MGKAVVLVVGCVLFAGACGEDQRIPDDGGGTGGVETGGASSGGAESGGTAETGGRATGGRASAGELGSGGESDVPGGAAGEAATAGEAGTAGDAGTAGSGGITGTGGASPVGGAGGAPAECWSEPGAGAPNLGLGGEAGASGEEIEACSDKACETVDECGIIGASLVCVGCTATLPACSCQCYQRFRKCGATCEEFEDCVKECIGLSC